MTILKVASRYLKYYPMLAIATMASIIAGSFCEGASFGMLIPLIQGMTGAGSSVHSNIGLWRHFGYFFGSTDQRDQLLFIFIALFLIIVAKNLFLYISTVLIAKFRFTFTRDRNVELMNCLIDYDLAHYDSADSGHLISVITNETQRMGDFILNALNFIALFVRVMIYIALLFFVSWKASIVAFFLIASVLVPLEIIVKKLKKLGGRISQALTDYNIKLTEIINGIRLIKGSVTEEAEKLNFKKVADGVCGAQFRINRYTSLLIPLSESMIFALIAISFLILMNVVKVNMAVSFPFVAAYLVVLVKTLTQLNTMNNMRSNAMSNLSAFSAYESLLEKDGMRCIENGAKTITKLLRSIVFDNVIFGYHPAKYVLKGVTAAIPAGKVTAIVGVSGSGKSTFVNLIMRFYDIQKGAIKIDGIDLRGLNLPAWRRMIGFVSQDIFIFNASVKDNISYGHPEVSSEAVLEAAAASGVDEFVRLLHSGYDTVLGERGIRLSGGQKQRISIARAIISNPEILIFDEATSSLDTETERYITSAISRLTMNRTVIAIAHRLSTVVNADNIIVLDNGIVSDTGSHKELINRSGLYKHFYELQFNVDGICGAKMAEQP